MHERGKALGISIPRRAPAVALKTDRDRALATLSKRFAAGTAPFMDRTLNRTDLAVYSLFAAHADPAGITTVGQDRIATLMQCSQQLVSRAYNKLKVRGYIKRTTKPASNGHSQNVTRILIDSTLTDADARSIASAPQHKARPITTTRVVIGQSPLSTELSTRTTPQRNTITTRINHSQSPLPDGGANGELIKPSHTMLQTAEQAIEHWRMCAWMHGTAHPVANDDDLAIAHALVAKGVTTAQLESAVLEDPESPRLAPLVRSLLA